jgi:hypothetical protein
LFHQEIGMHRILLCAAALAAAMPAKAQDAELREELKILQQRVQELESRIQAASRPQAENALNPAISAILNGTYANLSRDPATYRISGFMPSGETAPSRGFSLGESELALTANVDPQFQGTLIAALGPDDTVGIEEAYVQTLRLPRGFTLKAGRFFSGVGYQNQIHPHAWDFSDAPLAMKAFLGGQLGEDGVQGRWVAPTELYWDLGAELGRGRAFPASPSASGKNGFGSSNFFSHLGGDAGTGTAWQAGLSHLRTSPHERQFDDPASGLTNSFTGSSRLWVIDGILKWAPNRNATYRSLKLQGEYFRRTEDGELTRDVSAPARGGYSSRQSGWYAQAVYQFRPQWRVGYRYDRLSAGSSSFSGAIAAADFPILSPYSPKKHTAMLDWSPSEFSRIRLQLARDYSRAGEPDSQVFVQYIVSLGAHGAHRF